MNNLGVVAIGRNEGQRLVRCLESLAGRAALVVYVDSGSTDGSVERARSMGGEVVELQRDVPFTAARARNAGCQRLLELLPEVEFVQFVDGDCEVVSGWLEAAVIALREEPLAAVVTGRRRERVPNQTIYNQLCDLEWDTPCGEVDYCGGDALMRVAAWRAVDGYDPTLIAGEEPDLCLRLRRQGWKIRRIEHEMTLHDAAMTRFGQWWRRTKRAGHAYAEGATRHGRGRERHWVREARSIAVWGLLFPVIIVGLFPITHGWSLLLLLAYPALLWRVQRASRRRPLPAKLAWLYGLFTVVGKFPQALGWLQYHTNHLLRRSSRLIEYKGTTA